MIFLKWKAQFINKALLKAKINLWVYNYGTLITLQMADKRKRIFLKTFVTLKAALG